MATVSCGPSGTVSLDRVGGFDGTFGIGFRYSDALNFWSVQLSGNYLYVWKLVAGVKNSLVSDQLSANSPLTSAPVTLQVVLTTSGFTVKTISGGVTVTEYSSADTFNASAVEHGLIVRDVTVRVDNFGFVGT
jgi:hypothetical protein